MNRKVRHKVFVSFDNASRRFEGLRFEFNTSELKKRIQKVLEWTCESSSSVSVRFCGLEEMIESNGHFRAKPKPTDVLSFPADPLQELANKSLTQADFSASERDMTNLGDILICVPVCYNQARSRRQTLAQEIDRMIVHGLVHLKGFDHERSDEAWKIMSALERVLREQLSQSLGSPCYIKLVSS